MLDLGQDRGTPKFTWYGSGKRSEMHALKISSTQARFVELQIHPCSLRGNTELTHESPLIFPRGKPTV